MLNVLACIVDAAVSGLPSCSAHPRRLAVKQVRTDKKPEKVDAAIVAAAATLRDVAKRLERGPRQRAAEVLMRGSGAIDELSRQTDRLLPKAKRGLWRGWLRRGPTT